MKKIFALIFSACFWAVSCNDFVDVIPKGNTIPSTVDDLARLMNLGTMSADAPYIATISANLPSYCALYSDDYAITQDPDQPNYYVNTFTAMADAMTWTDPSENTDTKWNDFYAANYVVNYVLDNIEVVEEGDAYDRSEVKGCALVHRALNYFVLVNLYGKQYDASSSSTSETDLGVPLVLEADINKQLPRSTVADVYRQILEDLKEAISLLKIVVSEYRNIPSLSAAYALRARVHLQMQNYDEAYSDAVRTLELYTGLIDYNTCFQAVPGFGALGGIVGYPTPSPTNPEVLFSRYSTETTPVIPTERFLDILDTENDLRYTLFSYSLDGVLQMFYNYMKHSGINEGEVWLIKAEAALRKTNPSTTEAIAALDHLRSHRYKTAAYQPTSLTTAEELLVEILRERRREIRLNEMGFFDQKRLNLDPSTARTMRRTFLGTEYTLPVGDPRWQLPIPLNVMQLNPLMIQNER